MPKLYHLLLVLAAIILAPLLCGCSAVGGGPEPNTLRINLGTEPPSLDWHVSTDSTSFDVVSNLMVGLAQYRNDTSVAPACAERWDILDGGTRYVFHLRKDVKWTDGKPVVAGDFEYAWKRLLTPATGAQYAFFLYDILNAFEFNTGKIKDSNAVGAKALDDWTFEVKLKKPAGYFIYLMAFCPTFPQRKDVVEKHGDRWTEAANIVTNGPFYLKRWEHEYKIDLASNPNFFEGEPKLKLIKMFMVPEQATAFALYENNELDFIDNRSFSTPDVMRARSSPQYHNYPLLRNNYIGFNVTKKPFDDRRVRLAVSMAIDRDLFPKILRRGERPSFTWIPPGMAGYDKTSGTEFNPQKAKALLAEAGYPGGKNFPRVEVLFPNREDARLVVEKIQDELKRNLNVRIELVSQEWKVYLETLHRDAPPIYRASWGADFPDPETFGNLFTSTNGNNHTSWKNAQYDDMISRAAAEQDQKKRARLYADADRLLCAVEAPIAPTYLATQNIMIKPWVKGIGMNPLDLQFFKNVVIDSGSSRSAGGPPAL